MQLETTINAPLLKATAAKALPSRPNVSNEELAQCIHLIDD
jgi:hypothetical protein